MVRRTMYRVVSVLMVLSLVGVLVQVGEAASHKVLVVMSYEETYAWCEEVKEGIEAALAETCEIHYFYMETKRNLEGGPQKAQEAYALYQEFQPDGVITVDDNAQKMFVVPYLKDQVETPVMFCGVNADPEKYGYPASNVSGILERTHNKGSIAFARQLVPSIKTVGFIARDNDTGRANLHWFQSQADSYPVKIAAFRLVKTLKELAAAAEELKEECDLLSVETLEGILDEDGQSQTEKEAMPLVVKTFGKPTISTNLYRLEYGVLCAMIKRGAEQGETASLMLLQAMQGTPVSEIPITENKKGKRLLNVDTMKMLGIKPKPHVLQGVELVKTIVE